MRTFLRSKTGASLAVGLVVLATATGCAKRGKGLTQADKQLVKEHTIDELPAEARKVDVNFEDKIQLVGWKAEPEIAAPGTTVHLTLYWKKTGDLDAGWKLFTHVTTDDPRQAKGNLDCVGAIRQEKAANCTAQLYPPSDWEKDKIIVDSFDFNVPTDVTWSAYRFLVGIWKDDARLRIKNADANDGDNRANVVTLPTGVTPPKTEVPQLNAPKYGKAEIKIDGKLEEKLWQGAGDTGPFGGPGDGKVPSDHPVNGSAKIAWDDQNLYVAAIVADKAPDTPFQKTDKDPHLWEKASAIELMIQPGDPGDNKDYYEIQVDPSGAVFDTSWDDYNTPKDDGAGSFGHMDWSAGVKSAATVDKDSGYVIEMAIPWSSFKAREGIAIPPKPGDTWRINFYSFKDGQRAALAWSPILGQGNFHKSSRFGRVTFVDGAQPAAQVGSGAPSAMPAKLPGAVVLPKIVAPK
jgi:hypothetical protein